MKLNQKPEGLALLPPDQIRKKLKRDVQKWLNDGHQITYLPSGKAMGFCHYDSLNDMMVETGLRCEY